MNSFIPWVGGKGMLLWIINILDFIRYAAAFLITKQQYYEWRLDT